MRTTTEPAERFFDKIDIAPDGCWNWTAALDHYGYGALALSQPKRVVKAHRFGYELMVGAIPDGLQIDHLCRNPRCVNPDHMEPVTMRENVGRGRAWVVNTEKEVCPDGHLYAGDNLYVYPDGRRACRACDREAGRRYRERRRTYNHNPGDV